MKKRITGILSLCLVFFLCISSTSYAVSSSFIRETKKRANRGEKEAQSNLGLMYSRGEGVSKNKEQAFYWYKKAARQGLAQAQYNLAQAYFWAEGCSRDPEEAFYWYKRAAEQGLSLAQCQLGILYLEGTGVKEDRDKAIYWLKKAAKQGNALAKRKLIPFLTINRMFGKQFKFAFIKGERIIYKK